MQIFLTLTQLFGLTISNAIFNQHIGDNRSVSIKRKMVVVFVNTFSAHSLVTLVVSEALTSTQLDSNITKVINLFF